MTTRRPQQTRLLERRRQHTHDLWGEKVYLDYAPLQAVVRRAGGPAAAMAAAGLFRHTAEYDRVDQILGRACKSGRITVASADFVSCTVLRMHPCLIWGEAWWAAVDDVLARWGRDRRKRAESHQASRAARHVA